VEYDINVKCWENRPDSQSECLRGCLIHCIKMAHNVLLWNMTRP